MQCNRCHNTATLHITEVHDDDEFEELHLCEHCAHKYLYDQQQTKPASLKSSLAEQLAETEEPGLLAQHECSQCGLSFTEFRNTGRLGCQNDYIEFQNELLPLLENIHGETRHCGKTPRRLPQTKQTQNELMLLRAKLKQAVAREDYEAAATARDRIRELEES